jgi:hypothetical protein
LTDQAIEVLAALGVQDQPNVSTAVVSKALARAAHAGVTRRVSAWSAIAGARLNRHRCAWHQVHAGSAVAPLRRLRCGSGSSCTRGRFRYLPPVSCNVYASSSRERGTGGPSRLHCVASSAAVPSATRPNDAIAVTVIKTINKDHRSFPQAGGPSGSTVGGTHTAWHLGPKAPAATSCSIPYRL